MEPIIPNTLYEHKKTGEKYRVKCFADDKSFSRDGVYLVIYTSGERTFAREIVEFKERFRRVDEEETCS